jgi:hypothetical protein
MAFTYLQPVDNFLETGQTSGNFFCFIAAGEQFYGCKMHQ